MAVRRVTGGLVAALVFALAATVGVAPRVTSAAEPQGYEHFHTYAEMGQVIDSAAAQHPNIAVKFSLGQSYQGRAIRAIRLTANAPGGNHGRPEIFINGMIHGRERASGELAIHMIRVLSENYGRSTTLGQRVTRILNTTVVYIAPMINPDGAEYDISGGQFRKWRKNRQPIPGSNAIGVDLNRQFGYTWNCCGGSSGNPSSDFYRGPQPNWAPEVRAYRSFVNDRAQRLQGILSLHSAGRLVLWPYAYTKQDVPHDMTADDHRAMVALGRGMAQRNGYRAEQGSDLYIVDGDQDDDAYGRHGIFAFTIEMAKGSAKRYYPSRSELGRDLDRNRSAILWFLEQADCPYRAANLGSKYCAGSSAAGTSSDAAEPSIIADGFGSTVSGHAGAAVTPQAATSKYSQSVYDSSLVQPQKTNCWCVVASSRAWLRHLDPDFAVPQSDLNDFMTQHDKNDWTDPSTSYYMRCTRGSPSPSFAHDGRGLAWTLWNHRPRDLPYGFQDYRANSAKAMNWQFVRNIRATGQPVAAAVAAGMHMILVVGYKTKLDPFDERGRRNSLYGFRVWDPWYQAGFGSWSGWPAGGFAGNAYVTVQDWNQKYFRPDVNEGPYYYGKYVAVLPASSVEPPSEDPPFSYGQVRYQAANSAAGAASAAQLQPANASQAPSSSVAAAVAAGLREHDLLNDPDLGNLPAGYTLGNSVEVQSVSAGVPSYVLVELKVGARVRAVATVNRSSKGFVFGELRATDGTFRLPTSTELRSRAAALGLDRNVQLVWGFNDERVPPYAPFLSGRTADGRTQYVTPAGLSDALRLTTAADRDARGLN